MTIIGSFCRGRAHKFASILLVLFLGITLLSGCSVFRSREGQTLKYEEQHGPFSGRVVALEISRRALDQAVSRGASVNSLRMVEVFRRAEESGLIATPQYRLFDIKKGSVYDLVGLQTNDILLAAGGVVVFDPQGFKTFVSTVLRAVSDGTVNDIFITREGVPLRLQIKTVS